MPPPPGPLHGYTYELEIKGPSWLFLQALSNLLNEIKDLVAKPMLGLNGDPAREGDGLLDEVARVRALEVEVPGQLLGDVLRARRRRPDACENFSGCGCVGGRVAPQLAEESPFLVGRVAGLLGAFV
jgi:hypothetical protein